MSSAAASATKARRQAQRAKETAEGTKATKLRTAHALWLELCRDYYTLLQLDEMLTLLANDMLPYENPHAPWADGPALKDSDEFRLKALTAHRSPAKILANMAEYVEALPVPGAATADKPMDIADFFAADQEVPRSFQWYVDHAVRSAWELLPWTLYKDKRFEDYVGPCGMDRTYKVRTGIRARIRGGPRLLLASLQRFRAALAYELGGSKADYEAAIEAVRERAPEVLEPGARARTLFSACLPEFEADRAEWSAAEQLVHGERIAYGLALAEEAAPGAPGNDLLVRPGVGPLRVAEASYWYFGLDRPTAVMLGLTNTDIAAYVAQLAHPAVSIWDVPFTGGPPRGPEWIVKNDYTAAVQAAAAAAAGKSTTSAASPWLQPSPATPSTEPSTPQPPGTPQAPSPYVPMAPPASPASPYAPMTPPAASPYMPKAPPPSPASPGSSMWLVAPPAAAPFMLMEQPLGPELEDRKKRAAAAAKKKHAGKH